MDAKTAKAALIAGNKRFINESSGWYDAGEKKREKLAVDGQEPFALIIGCSDSRVPPEVIFDRGLGDLFVIRTAGNVVDDVCLGSVEYGAEHLGIPLIVVLGHESCGAVKATVEGGEVHGCLKSVVDKIDVSLKKVTGSADLPCACEDENVRTTVATIKANPIIKELIDAGKTTVVGAKYGIKSGLVTFFD